MEESPKVINAIDFFTNTKHFIKNRYFEGMCEKIDSFHLNTVFIKQLFTKIIPDLNLKKWKSGTNKYGKKSPMDIMYYHYCYLSEKDKQLLGRIYFSSSSENSSLRKNKCFEKLCTEIDYMISFLECIMFPKISEDKHLKEKCIIDPTLIYCPVIDGKEKFVEVDDFTAIPENNFVKQYDITWTFDKKRLSYVDNNRIVINNHILDGIMHNLFKKISDGKQRYFADYCDENMFYSNMRHEIIHGMVENWLFDKFQGYFDNYNYYSYENPLIIKYVHLWSEEEIYSDNTTEKRDDQYKIKVSLTVSRIKNDCVTNYIRL